MKNILITSLTFAGLTATGGVATAAASREVDNLEGGVVLIFVD